MSRIVKTYVRFSIRFGLTKQLIATHILDFYYVFVTANKIEYIGVLQDMPPLA